MSIDKELLQILACPLCRGEVQILETPAENNNVGAEAQPEGLACAACAVVYPLREGIPVMLREEAVPRLEWNGGKRRVIRRGRT